MLERFKKYSGSQLRSSYQIISCFQGQYSPENPEIEKVNKILSQKHRSLSLSYLFNLNIN
jgi:hypothetical protein